MDVLLSASPKVVVVSRLSGGWTWHILDATIWAIVYPDIAGLGPAVSPDEETEVGADLGVSDCCLLMSPQRNRLTCRQDIHDYSNIKISRTNN